MKPTPQFDALQALSRLDPSTRVTMPGPGQNASREAALIGKLEDQHPYELAREWNRWEWTIGDAIRELTYSPADLAAPQYVGGLDGCFDAPIPDRFTRDWIEAHYIGPDRLGIGLTLNGDEIEAPSARA